jgi:DNA-binding response OmpR family regulator
MFAPVGRWGSGNRSRHWGGATPKEALMLTQANRVLVALKNDADSSTLVENLRADGYVPLPATTLGHACSRLSDHVDAAIVDLGSDTLQLIDAIRQGGHTSADVWLPIMAGAVTGDMFHAVRLLERGADDVIYEPWLYLEVRARLGALLRRATVTPTRQLLRAGALRVDVTARRAWIGDTEIELTAREFDLLRVLVTDPDRVFTRSELLKTVWGLGDWARTRTLDSHAARLRQRLNSAGGGAWVRNVWGVGYRLTDTGAAG